MEFISPELQQYVTEHSSAVSPLLSQIDRETHLEVLQPRMLSGHFQGRVLSMLAQLLKPTAILEIGTYTGYSALCLAEGLTPDGKLITIDVNEELAPRVRSYFEASAYAQQIDYRIGNAAQLIPTLQYTFDLIFIDADKQQYPLYYEQALEKLKPGGFILIDNVLWSGKVLDTQHQDKDSVLLRELNLKISQDARVEKVLLPIRDGLYLIRKK
ncbi:MAG: O-methyltransferase [Flavobacteriia bacterium]|jgi:caffeoyl-CoA O-methyltransferase|nr:O-methyltransferase [Flavobacteriia bacterium]